MSDYVPHLYKTYNSTFILSVFLLIIAAAGTLFNWPDLSHMCDKKQDDSDQYFCPEFVFLLVLIYIKIKS